MPTGSLESAVAFCRGHADGIRWLLLLDALADGAALRAEGSARAAQGRLVDAVGITLVDPLALIEQTPLLQALRRQLADRDQGRLSAADGAG